MTKPGSTGRAAAGQARPSRRAVGQAAGQAEASRRAVNLAAGRGDGQRAPAPGGSLDRAANLAGALSLVIADQAADAVAAAAGRSASAGAALSALLHFLDRPSVDLLRQVLGLTSSGTVRLLDRLEESGYVRREPGTDGRSTAVVLTEAGREAAMGVSRARAEVLERSLAVLSPAERAEFERLCGTVLAGMIRGPGATRWICRLCDIGACRGAAGGCPVGNAARERYSPD